MTGSRLLRAGIVGPLLALAVAACGTPTPGPAAAVAAVSGGGEPAGLVMVPACPQAAPGRARCLAMIADPVAQPLARSKRRPSSHGRSVPAPPPTSASARPSTPVPATGRPSTPATRRAGLPAAASPPAAVPATDPAPQVPGLHPIDLHGAYGLPDGGGAGRTIAVVDAMDDPQAEADLAVYRSTFGLPPCTTANGCFRKVDGSGGTHDPAADPGWAKEISVDLDMTSAACPDCHILLVEAASPDLPTLGAAEDTAARTPGVVAITNSFGVAEQPAETGWDVHFHHPGIAIVAAAGDGGYGTVYPAASPYVTAVGGTSLMRSATPRGWTETAWSGGGSGCSSYEPKPSWQPGRGCPRRAAVDVAAVADPATGVSVYDSYQSGGWLVAGGTSAAAPIVAAAYVLAGNAATAGPGFPYAHAGALHDVTSGSNALLCVSVLCSAGIGWDGPTGLGTPAGTGAF
jgi:Subtilase family